MLLISGQGDTRQKKLQQLLHKNSKTTFFIYLMMPVMIFLWVVDQASETEEEYTEPTQLMKTNWSKKFLEMVQYRSREEDAGQEEAQGEASVCLVKDVEINHPKMSELELNTTRLATSCFTNC